MSKYNPDIHHRKSIRLQGYDYSGEGMYFITICAQNREKLFGEIENGKTRLFHAGVIAEKCWMEIPRHYPFVILDEFVVMPNHIHGIITIQDTVGANDYSPLHMDNPPTTRINGTSQTIGAIVRGYKIGVTKWFRINTEIDIVWQRNYYEHVIRNKKSLNNIRKYITNNPVNWEKDELYT